MRSNTKVLSIVKTKVLSIVNQKEKTKCFAGDVIDNQRSARL